MNQITKPAPSQVNESDDDAEIFRVLSSATYPGAKPESVRMVMNYCKAAGLNPLLKVVHIVPMSVKVHNQKTGREDYEWRDVVMPGIAHYRTRLAACPNLPLSGPNLTGGWFDLDAGLLYRKGDGERSTNKRRTPARLPRQLAAQARRWAAAGSTWAIEFRGSRVASIKTAWVSVAADAALGWNVTPHTLKHTAITWAIQGGATVADAASYFSTSTETIERVYWHLSPDFQQGAVAAMERRGGAESRAKKGPAAAQKKSNAGETRADGVVVSLKTTRK